jgi:hypothetical protein
MRAVEKNSIGSFSISPPDVPLTISTRIPIHFCPWCGIKLAKFYKKHFQLLSDKTIADEFDIPLE